MLRFCKIRKKRPLFPLLSARSLTTQCSAIYLLLVEIYGKQKLEKYWISSDTLQQLSKLPLLALFTLPLAHATICTCYHLHVLPPARATTCLCYHQHVLPSACATICTCYHLHVLPSACAATCTCYHLHVLPSARALMNLPDPFMLNNLLMFYFSHIKDNKIIT